MTTTLAYDAYDSKRGAIEPLEDEQSSRLGDTRVRAGLAPADLPLSIEIHASPTNSMRIVFAYSNYERPEPTWRSASADGRVRVLLGEHSRKVMELEASVADALLKSSSQFIEPRAMADWLSGLPAQAYKTSLRSALLVMHLLETMPKVLKKKVLQALSPHDLRG